MSQLLLMKKVMPLNGKIDNLDNFLSFLKIWYGTYFFFAILLIFGLEIKLARALGRITPTLIFLICDVFRIILLLTLWRTTEDTFFPLIVCHVWITVKASKFYIKHCHGFSWRSTQFKKTIEFWKLTCYWWKQSQKTKNKIAFLYKFGYKMTCVQSGSGAKTWIHNFLSFDSRK